MRIISIITAILVSALLFAVVFQREALLEFARQMTPAALLGDEAPAPATEEAAEAPAPEAQEQAAETTRPGTVSVIALRSVAREVDSAVVLRGETTAARQVEVRSETTARVMSEPLRKGSFVNEGQLLCRLEPGTREASLAEAEARLAEARARVPEAQARVVEAQARLEEARINDNAASSLRQDGFASATRVATTKAAVSSAEASVESAKSGLESAQAGIEAAEAAVASAKKEIERLEIMAPFEGLLESDTAEIGSLLQAGGICGTVIQLDPIKLVAFVPETEVARIEIGARAGARLTGGEQTQGRVTFLSRSADETTRTFRVEVEVPNPALSLRAGQTAEILIEAEGAMAHLLPQSALTLNDEGALGVRTVAEGEVALFMPVTLMRDTREGVLVSGLPDVVDVITVGQEYVIDGVPVAATFKEVTQ
ncbi:efflux RND transporter periplasmic adaptor subunit [Primorskyibacter sedentarius]|uniref:efflux RND transporter periplasmic adaptor subunit n=1 Tax=Primorskyibacter sedentarius TaxID=745311 RepID=UPI003EC1067C